jgi:hypothetical protein
VHTKDLPSKQLVGGRAARVQEEIIRTAIGNPSIDGTDNDVAVARYPTGWGY